MFLYRLCNLRSELVILVISKSIHAAPRHYSIAARRPLDGVRAHGQEIIWQGSRRRHVHQHASLEGSSRDVFLRLEQAVKHLSRLTREKIRQTKPDSRTPEKENIDREMESQKLTVDLSKIYGADRATKLDQHGTF